jgi:chemotaxis protein CheY-P-specific phosphatase CheC
MMNAQDSEFDFLLKNSFDSGYTNASVSLTQLTKCPAHYNNFQHGSVRLDSEFLETVEHIHLAGSYVLLTTQIFGDVTGKSYLFLPEPAMEILTSTIPSGGHPSINFKEEFIKELNNILSAAVITKLSNQLAKKMFGDVPELIGKVTCHLCDIIQDDFSEDMEEVYVNGIYFLLENHHDVRPLFVWVLDKSNL